MALSQQETAWFEGLLESYDGNEGSTSEWRRGFMKDQQDRFAKYKSEMFLSPKQWNVLNGVAEDLGYEGPSSSGGSTEEDPDGLSY